VSKRRLLFNSVSGVSLLATNIVIAFVMTPIMVHHLGNSNYGIWELLVALVGYLGIFELGIGPALVRYVADAWSREDRAAVARIFNTGVFSLAGTGAVGLVVLLVVATWPEHFMSLTGPDARRLAPVLVVFGLNLAAYLPRTALSAYLLGLQAHLFVNVIQGAVAIIASVAMYYVLTQGSASPLIWLAMIVLFGTLLQSAAMLYWILVVDARVCITASSFSWSTAKELLGFGLKSTIIQASTGMLVKLTGFAIAYTVGVGQLVYFVVPSRLVDYANSLGTQLGFPLTPYFTHLAGNGNPAAARSAWLQTTRILQIMMFLLPIGIIVLGEPFIRLWIGQEYAEKGRWTLYILCAALLAQGVVSNGARILMSLGRHGRVAWFAAIFAPICLAVSLGLGAVWGIEGVAAAVALYTVGVHAVEVTLTCFVLDVGIGEYLRATVFRFTVPIVVTTATLIGLRVMSYPASYGQLILYGLVGGVIYFVTVWLMALEPAERKGLLDVVVRRRQRASNETRPRLDSGGA